MVRMPDLTIGSGLVFKPDKRQRHYRGYKGCGFLFLVHLELLNQLPSRVVF
jgi:hypothetical protein